MDEAEWLTSSDPRRMLSALGDRAGGRKLRLVACACVRRLWPVLYDHRSRACVEHGEGFAEGQVGGDLLPPLSRGGHAAADAAAVQISLGAAWHAARAAARTCAQPMRANVVNMVAQECATAAWGEDGPRLADPAEHPGERRAQAALLREIVGNPFRAVAVSAAVRHWNDGTVVKLAEAIHATGRYGDLPLLHDALLDAGCEEDDILAHCRAADGHVKGCWVIDLILGKK